MMITLVSGANLVLDLRATGLGGQAERLRGAVREAVGRMLGDQHPMLDPIEAPRRLERPVETPSP